MPLLRHIQEVKSQSYKFWVRVMKSHLKTIMNALCIAPWKTNPIVGRRGYFPSSFLKTIRWQNSLEAVAFFTILSPIIWKDFSSKKVTKNPKRVSDGTLLYVF